jgi:hypothetical protein
MVVGGGGATRGVPRRLLLLDVLCEFAEGLSGLARSYKI